MKRQLALNFKSDVPAIIFTTVPTVLVLVDGPPALQPMPGLDVERVVNTRALIVKLNGLFYLTALNYWYEAAAIEGPWAPTDEPPAILARARQDAPAQVDLMGSAAAAPGTGTPPALRVSTVPAELIQTAGPPQMLPVEGTFLLRVRNTRDAIFVDLNSNLHYAQVSGKMVQDQVAVLRSVGIGARRPPAGGFREDSDAGGACGAARAARRRGAAEVPAARGHRGAAARQLCHPATAASADRGDSGVSGSGLRLDRRLLGLGPRGWIWIGGRWGIGVDVGPIGVWFGGGHFWHGGHGWGGHSISGR